MLYLPTCTSQELERIQKRALKIIVPALSYSEALQALNLRTLDERRNELCVKTLREISRGGPLVKHLPMTSQHSHPYQTRGATKYSFFEKGCLTNDENLTQQCRKLLLVMVVLRLNN